MGISGPPANEQNVKEIIEQTLLIKKENAVAPLAGKNMLKRTITGLAENAVYTLKGNGVRKDWGINPEFGKAAYTVTVYEANAEGLGPGKVFTAFTYEMNKFVEEEGEEFGGKEVLIHFNAAPANNAVFYVRVM